jgi:hypothetical protein
MSKGQWVYVIAASLAWVLIAWRIVRGRGE